jgi:hypothetical protein
MDFWVRPTLEREEPKNPKNPKNPTNWYYVG